jgi:hypothetical protein
MKVKHVLTTLALAVPAAGGVAGPAAAAEGVTWHASTDVAGSGVTITCGELTLTPTSGSLRTVFHESRDSAGIYHYTGTDSADGIVMSGDDDRGYELRGASSFTGRSTDPEGKDNLVFTTTASFVVVDSSGGRIGMVHLVQHLAGDRSIELDSGSCTGNGGDGDE